MSVSEGQRADMRLEWDQDQSNFADAARGILTRLKGDRSPDELAADPDSNAKVWATAEDAGWLEMAGPSAIRDNFEYATILAYELGRSGLISMLPETMAANAVLGLALRQQQDPSAMSPWDSRRTLALTHARAVENLLPFNGSSDTLLVPWIGQADEVIVPVRLGEDGPIGLGFHRPDRRDHLVTRLASESLDLTESGYLSSDLNLSLSAVWLSGDPGPGNDLWAGLGAARLLLAWEILGHTSRALELTAGHVQVREQFGRTLASMEPVEQRLADMWIHFEASELLAREAVSATRNGRRFRSLTETATYAAGRAGERILQDSIHLHGGIGYMWEYELHWHYRRVKTLRMRLGTVVGQLSSVASELLSEVRDLSGPTWTLIDGRDGARSFSE